MHSRPLKSLITYSHFVAELLDRSDIAHSTVTVWSDSSYTGIAQGDIFFAHHKHIHPDIKHHRIAASEISFARPNLPMLIREIKELIKATINPLKNAP